jgi:N utilization substance protein B
MKGHMAHMDDSSNPYTGGMPEEDSSSYISGNSLSQRDQRSLTFHLLYAMDAFAYDVSLEYITQNLMRGFGYEVQPRDKVFQVAGQVIAYRNSIDQEIYPLLQNWKFERIGVATRLILRYALWELLYTDLDVTIVINEAIELSKCFAEHDAYRFINGILDQWALQNQDKLASKKEASDS